MKTFWRLGIGLLVSLFLVGCGQSAANEAVEKPQEVTIYFVRHGKTMLNTVDRSQGWIDAPLTPAGVEQIEQLGKGLAEVDFDLVYSSDSGRAIETAELILKQNQEKGAPEIIKDKRLREYNFGTYEGLMNEEMQTAVAEKEGITYEAFLERMKQEGFYQSILKFADVLAVLDRETAPKDQSNWPAEDSQTIINRLNQALASIISEARDKQAENVLVVSHGMSLITLLAQLDETTPLPENGLKNASVSKVTYQEDEFQILSVNDLSYVEEGAKK